MKKTALAFLLILTLLIPSLANAQITSYYGRKEGVNPAAFTLTIYSPNDQTAYANTMLLNFNITWTTFPSFIPPSPSLKGDYAYSIDDSPLIPIESNQSASARAINPYFSYLVNVSNLANGYHKIVIIAGLYSHSDYYYINQSCIPTLFLVQNPTPTPTPFPSSIPSSFSRTHTFARTYTNTHHYSNTNKHSYYRTHTYWNNNRVFPNNISYSICWCSGIGCRRDAGLPQETPQAQKGMKILFKLKSKRSP